MTSAQTVSHGPKYIIAIDVCFYLVHPSPLPPSPLSPLFPPPPFPPFPPCPPFPPHPPPLPRVGCRRFRRRPPLRRVSSPREARFSRRRAKRGFAAAARSAVLWSCLFLCLVGDVCSAVRARRMRNWNDTITQTAPPGMNRKRRSHRGEMSGVE